MKYSPHQYAKALRALADESPSGGRREAVREFLAALSKNWELSLLPDILREFEQDTLAKAKLHEVSARAPERLSESAVARKLPFRARVNSVRDVRLAGGAVLEVDGLRIDNSVNMRLSRIREALTG